MPAASALPLLAPRSSFSVVDELQSYKREVLKELGEPEGKNSDDLRFYSDALRTVDEVVDHLRGDVLVGPEHGQTGTLGCAAHRLADPVMTTQPIAATLLRGVRHGYLAAFPALRITRSPA